MRQVAVVLAGLWVFFTGTCSVLAGAREAAEALHREDFAGAMKACKADAEAGDPVCQNIVGALYANGKGVDADPAEAARWFRRAAEKGDGYAALNLGNAYRRGQGVKKDNEQAEKWFRVAAEQGIPGAQLNLGILMIDSGEDAKEGVKWIRAAAAQRLPQAQSALGFAYENGNGVRKNYRSAAKWYETAADHGDSPAASRLASLYERGLGVEADLEEAYFWYHIALSDERDPYRKSDEQAVKRIASQLPKKQIAAADQAISEWRPQAIEIGKPKRSRSKKKQKPENHEPELFGTGSGFFVSRAGHLITNNHVVDQCTEMRVSDGDKSVPAEVLATDPARDLALLKISRSTQAAIFRGEQKLRPGENVVVVGFPLQGLLTSDPVVTTGIVSALAGIHDDRRFLQVSAPVQPGNSGGPLLDASGHIIGVIVAKLNATKVAQVTGVIPENVNFAVSGDEAKAFLKANAITIETSADGKELSTAAIADKALAVTVRLECWQ